MRPHRRPLLPTSLAAAAALLFAPAAMAQQPQAPGPEPAASGQAPAPAGSSAAPAPAGSSAPAAPAPPAAPAAPAAPAPPGAPEVDDAAPGDAEAGDAAPTRTDARGAPVEAASGASATDYPYIPVVSERRSNVVLGLVLSPVVSFASGSPGKVNKRDQTVETGAAVGTGFSVFLGGAFTDWFSFHIGATSTSAAKGNYETSGAAVIFGVETWPLFSRGGVFRDLGLGLDFGTGSANVFDKRDKDHALAEGGGFSMVRGQVLWDALTLWRVNLGPTLGYEYRTADTFSEKIVWLGLRTALYTGP
jgi:hypothetical protein